MSHTITSKLNQDARQHQGANGTTFFVSLGEKNFNFETKENEYTNYEAALFAKDNQIAFYQSALVKDAIIEVTGTGLLMKIDPTGQYKPKLMIQDAKLGFIHNPQGQQAPQQQAPQGYQQPQQGFTQQPQQSQSPQNAAYVQPMQQPNQPMQQAPQPQNGFGNNEQNIPF
jgi:single-strand DNA-binding protein